MRFASQEASAFRTQSPKSRAATRRRAAPMDTEVDGPVRKPDPDPTFAEHQIHTPLELPTRCPKVAPRLIHFQWIGRSLGYGTRRKWDGRFLPLMLIGRSVELDPHGPIRISRAPRRTGRSSPARRHTIPVAPTMLRDTACCNVLTIRRERLVHGLRREVVVLQPVLVPRLLPALLLLKREPLLHGVGSVRFQRPI